MDLDLIDFFGQCCHYMTVYRSNSQNSKRFKKDALFASLSMSRTPGRMELAASSSSLEGCVDFMSMTMMIAQACG